MQSPILTRNQLWYVVLLERIKFQERAEVGSTAVGPCTETVLKNIQGMNHISEIIMCEVKKVILTRFSKSSVVNSGVGLEIYNL